MQEPANVLHENPCRGRRFRKRHDFIADFLRSADGGHQQILTQAIGFMSMEDQQAVICRIPFSALKPFEVNGQVVQPPEAE